MSFPPKKGVAVAGFAALSLLIAYGGWKWGSAVFLQGETGLGPGGNVEVEKATPEFARVAGEKLNAFRESRASELRLESVEVSSLLLYSVPGMIPDGVIEPQVTFAGDRIVIRARVLPVKIPNFPEEIEGILGVLPDTVPVEVNGSLVPLADGEAMLLVSGIRVRRMPIPRRIFTGLMSAMGRRSALDLPPSAVRVPVPRGVGGVYIEGGQLVLVRA